MGRGGDAGHGARAPRARRVVVVASSYLLHALKHAGIPRPGPMRPAQPFAIAVSEPMMPLPRVIALTTSILGRAYRSPTLVRGRRVLPEILGSRRAASYVIDWEGECWRWARRPCSLC